MDSVARCEKPIAKIFQPQIGITALKNARWDRTELCTSHVGAMNLRHDKIKNNHYLYLKRYGRL